MKEVFPLPEVPGYVSIKQAAHILGVSERSVYRYIEAGRLPAFQAGDNILLSIEAVEQFKVNIIGRPRKKTPAWHISPDNNPFLILRIQVQIRPGQQKKLKEKLFSIRQDERYVFPGTVARYISLEDASPLRATIQLVWKNNEVPDEKSRKKMLEEFESELADVLDWSTAQYSTSNVIMHT